MFSNFKNNFIKTKQAFDSKFNNIFGKNKQIDEIIDELEEILILSDLGVETSLTICQHLRDNMKKEPDKSEEKVKEILKQEIVQILDKNVSCVKQGKRVILVVGVNGVGKTTSIGKLTHLLQKEGKKVLLAAGDTFRAGAIDQLAIWAERCKADIVMGVDGQDPSSVIYQASQKFASSDYDVLVCDTAGRLHNKKNLMDELEKMKKTIEKNLGDILLDVYIVLDATTGQNATLQVKSFFERTSVSGIILTKLDSTAKGGVVVSICHELQIPIEYIGTGEQIEDMQPFDSKKFVDSIL